MKGFKMFLGVVLVVCGTVVVWSVIDGLWAVISDYTAAVKQYQRYLRDVEKFQHRYTPLSDEAALYGVKVTPWLAKDCS